MSGFRAPVFIITLPHARGRADGLVADLADMGIDSTVVIGVRPTVDVTTQVLERFQARVPELRFRRKLLAPEFGCTLAHMRLYARIVREGLQGAVIMEDDAGILPPFQSFYEALHPSLPPVFASAREHRIGRRIWHMANLRARCAAWLQVGDLRATPALRAIGGTTTYWIDRRSALLMLNHLSVPIDAIDNMFLQPDISPQWVWLTRLDSGATTHSLAVKEASTIWSHRLDRDPWVNDAQWDRLISSKQWPEVGPRKRMWGASLWGFMRETAHMRWGAAPTPGSRRRFASLSRSSEPTVVPSHDESLAEMPAIPRRRGVGGVISAVVSRLPGVRMMQTWRAHRQDVLGQHDSQRRPISRVMQGPYPPVFLAQADGTSDAAITLAHAGCSVMAMGTTQALPYGLRCVDVVPAHWRHIHDHDGAWARVQTHLAIWQRIANLTEGCGALVIEPQVQLREDVRGLLEVLHHRGSSFSLLNLSANATQGRFPMRDDPIVGRRAERFVLDGARQCSVNLGASSLAGAYWLSKGAAQRLLNEAVPLRGPIEHVLFGWPWAFRPHWITLPGMAPFADLGHPAAVSAPRLRGARWGAARLRAGQGIAFDQLNRITRPAEVPIGFHPAWIHRTAAPGPLMQSLREVRQAVKQIADTMPVTHIRG